MWHRILIRKFAGLGSMVPADGAAFTDQNDVQSATISRNIGRHFWRADNFRKAGRRGVIRLKSQNPLQADQIQGDGEPW